MNKICTSIEQSKKLIELGIDVNTADMYYPNRVSIDNLYYPKRVGKDNYVLPIVWKIGHPLLSQEIPCWSLTALLNIIPKHIKEYNTLRIDIGEKDFSIWYDEIGYGVNTELPDITMENPVDACVEMIIKLKELNLL